MPVVLLVEMPRRWGLFRKKESGAEAAFYRAVYVEAY